MSIVDRPGPAPELRPGIEIPTEADRVPDTAHAAELGRPASLPPPDRAEDPDAPKTIVIRKPEPGAMSQAELATWPQCCRPAITTSAVSRSRFRHTEASRRHDVTGPAQGAY